MVPYVETSLVVVSSALATLAQFQDEEALVEVSEGEVGAGGVDWGWVQGAMVVCRWIHLSCAGPHLVGFLNRHWMRTGPDLGQCHPNRAH